MEYLVKAVNGFHQVFDWVLNTSLMFWILNYEQKSFVVCCAILYHFYHLKNVKNTHGGVLRLVKLQASACNFTKSSTLPWVFFTFFKLFERYQIAQSTTIYEITFCDHNHPVDTGHKLNVHKTFRKRPGSLLNILCTFSLRPVSTR